MQDRASTNHPSQLPRLAARVHDLLLLRPGPRPLERVQGRRYRQQFPGLLQAFFGPFDSAGFHSKSIDAAIAILTKGPRMAMCRFHSIHAVQRHMRPIRHKRLVMWRYLGINLRYVKSLKSSYMVDRLKLA